MTDNGTPLGRLVVAHYGKALKEGDRDDRGEHPVFGSNGEVGRHSEALVAFPTIVIGRKGSVGEVTYAPQGGWPIDTAYYLERLDPERVDLRYLYWALRNARLDRRVITTSIPGLNRDELYRTRILEPSVHEQQRIAATLDKVDVIQRKQRERIRLLDELVRSAFLDMFAGTVKHLRSGGLPTGWQLVTVESIAAKVPNACAGGPFGSSLTRADYVEAAGVPVIRGTNLVADRAVFREEKFVFVSDEKAQQLRRNAALPGDIVFTQRGTLGQVAQIPLNAKYPRYIISQSQMKITLDETVVDPTYFVHYFLSPQARTDLEARTLATGVPHINLSILKRFPIVLPPLTLQHRFAAVASQFAVCRQHMESAMSDADSLANSLMQRAFGGDLTSALDSRGDAQD